MCIKVKIKKDVICSLEILRSFWSWIERFYGLNFFFLIKMFSIILVSERVWLNFINSFNIGGSLR